MNLFDASGIELFAGCGGLSTGFLDAGLNVVAGFELDRRAVDAYEYNHGYRGSHGHQADLSSLESALLLSRAGLRQVDFLIGGPPCQPFSIAGKQRGESDHRANLMNRFASYISELLPTAFMLENVPNLAAIHGGRVLQRFIEAGNRSGYAMRAEVVRAADFGVAQMRKRLIVVGIRGVEQVDFPVPTHGIGKLPHRTAHDVLFDLPDVADFGECDIHNHEPTQHSVGMLQRLSVLQPGKREPGSFQDRLHPNRVSYTLRAGSGNFSPLRPIHYRYDRVISVRESARIQGFSDHFIWPDRIPRLQQYRQVGNAVPPSLAAAFAKSIAMQLGWRLQPERFVGDPASRPPAMQLTDAQRKAQRAQRTRGASLGLMASA